VESARRATSTDVERIVELWGAACAELLDQRGGRLLAATNLEPPPAPAELALLLEHPNRLVVVGQLDEQVLGFAVATTRAVSRPGAELTGERADLGDGRQRPARLGSIEVLYVEPDARAVGLGEAVLSAVSTWCEALGCVGIDAPALPGNRPAKAFFEDHGYQARLLVMYRGIPTS
jgi:GNAT superfamily N-acetyltransferase